MKCVKCGRLDARTALGSCLECIVAEQFTELEQLRRDNANLRERVRDLERECDRRRGRS
jgi:hypothetical protein